VHECPFSRRVFEKPRGYPGDAEMLDFAYGYSTIGSEATATTRELFEWTMQSSGLRSVRARRQILAEKIDEVAARSSQARVFAVGSGHLREAAVSRAIATGQLGDVIAFDRDRASLAVVARDYGANGVRIVQGRVQSLFDGTLELPTFDLVYSAGLYDYLPWWLARQLTTLLFGMVAPGGRLLIANAAPARPHAAYIEAYLDWWLIYRDEAQLTEVAEGIPDRDTQTRHSFQDREGNIVFLEVVKA
jgi:extracellular factor (EF) 3-hydroxypalmitic acid methyl ester biosynthesis protein